VSKKAKLLVGEDEILAVKVDFLGVEVDPKASFCQDSRLVVRRPSLGGSAQESVYPGHEFFPVYWPCDTVVGSRSQHFQGLFLMCDDHDQRLGDFPHSATSLLGIPSTGRVIAHQYNQAGSIVNELAQ